MTGPARLVPSLRVDEVPARFQERAVVLHAGGWGGAELRPTRLFLWLGARDSGHEWLLPLALSGGSPRLLRRARRRRYLLLGREWEVSYLGNPLVTLGLVAYRLTRRMLQRRPVADGQPDAADSLARWDP